MARWRPDYSGYGHRTRLYITVWGNLRRCGPRWWSARFGLWTLIHPRCVARRLGECVRGWRYAGTIHRFERMATAVGNGPIPEGFDGWDDFREWFRRMTPRTGTVIGLHELCARETPRERVRKYCGRDPDDMTDEELFATASSMLGHYSDRMYPNAFCGARLCIETVMARRLYPFLEDDDSEDD